MQTAFVNLRWNWTLNRKFHLPRLFFFLTKKKNRARTQHGSAVCKRKDRSESDALSGLLCSQSTHRGLKSHVYVFIKNHSIWWANALSTSIRLVPMMCPVRSACLQPCPSAGQPYRGSRWKNTKIIRLFCIYPHVFAQKGSFCVRRRKEKGGTRWRMPLFFCYVTQLLLSHVFTSLQARWLSKW